MPTLLAPPGRSPFEHGCSASPRCAPRVWLAAGAAGLLLLLALPVIGRLWTVNEAGILINRYTVRQDPSYLVQAQRVLQDASPSPGTSEATPGDGPSFWRTYGAAAAQRPTEEAFERLLGAFFRGRLDRFGLLWLGEVASHTGHWEAAQEVYALIDASNLLIARGDAALDADDPELAWHWYMVAASSIFAAEDRGAGRSGGGSPGQAAAVPENGLQAPEGSRVVPLLRIGRGLLRLDRPQEALPVLERAESEMHADPPGTRERQAIYFSLAQALIGSGRDIAVDEEATLTRVRALIEQALDIDDTGTAHLQAGQSWELAGLHREAIEELQKAVALDPRLGQAYLDLGAIYERDGLTSLARDLYAAGVEHLPTDTALLTARALADWRTLAPREALPALLAAAATDTREPYLFAALGDTYLELGDLENARAAYKEGLLRTPGAPPLRERLTKLLPPSGVTP